jgi:pimeloyl-ACP methyl ester carboxylesterase
MAGALAELLGVLELSPALAVGHSAGAAILIRMSLDGRLAPKGIVSLNGALVPFRGGLSELFSPLAKLLFVNPLVPRLFAWGAGEAAVARMIRDTGSTLDPEGIALYARLVRNPAHIAGALGMMADWDLKPLVRDLPRLSPPLLLVVGPRTGPFRPTTPLPSRAPPLGRDRAPEGPRPPRARGAAGGGGGDRRAVRASHRRAAAGGVGPASECLAPFPRSPRSPARRDGGQHTMAGEKGGIVRRAAGAGILAAAAGGIGLSRFLVPHDLPLPPALDAERREFEGKRAGRLSFYVSGNGPPLLLIHSINAAGSAYEVRPLHERLKGRRLYAPDLPGFGFSDRSDRPYDARLYVDALHDMLDLVAAEAGPEPIDAVALSLSAEFLARAAVEHPERFRTLALVTPTGFDKRSGKRRGPPGASLEVPGLYRTFTFPLWSQAIYDALVSRASIRYFLQRTFGRKDIDEGLLEYDYLTAHQPGRATPLTPSCPAACSAPTSATSTSG